MSLEAVMICLDNSEYMRNGDYVPTRFEAQHDAINLIVGAKTQQHAESCVGVIAMACSNQGPEVLVNLTNDFGQILTSVHKAKISGYIHFTASLNVARLALKHRQNRNQRQRIVFFVGSPVQEDVKQLTTLGKNLKKNNVSVDVINFGQEAENTEKLDAFVNSVDRDGTSHLVTIPPGPHILSDILVTSAIIREEGAGVGGGAGTGGGAGNGYDFGVNPELDPELAMALRLSEEEYQREQQQLQSSTGQGNTTPVASTPQSSQQQTQQQVDESMFDDMDEEMRLAIQMSLAETNTSQPTTTQPETPTTNPSTSVGSENTSTTTPAEQSTPSSSDLLSDPNYVRSILGSLPGVDTTDPNIAGMLNNLKNNKDKKDEKKDDDKMNE
eukprot:c17925_g1_i1.p1 GENE.c17925_g1_i1~~c17925_g1_i1.p1  ORF type:complete len:384 (-),score=179.94 c17925_g1_i1:39-1190(-)